MDSNQRGKLEKLKTDILIETYERSVQIQNLYRFKEIHELKSYYDHPEETVEAIKQLVNEGLIQILDGDSTIITKQGKKFIKDCIRDHV